jgi:hypothetical protein
VRAWLNDTDAIKAAAFTMVKERLFDIGSDESAEQSPEWWSSVFGASKVTLKSDHAKTGVVLRHTLTLHGAISAEQTVEGDLSELAHAVEAGLDRYLTLTDVAGF